MTTKIFEAIGVIASWLDYQTNFAESVLDLLQAKQQTKINSYLSGIEYD